MNKKKIHRATRDRAVDALVNVREISDRTSAPSDCVSATPANCDTAVYSGPRSQYTITANAEGSVTVKGWSNSSTMAGRIRKCAVLERKIRSSR